jgi:hypothetical protein
MKKVYVSAFTMFTFAGLLGCHGTPTDTATAKHVLIYNKANSAEADRLTDKLVVPGVDGSYKKYEDTEPISCSHFGFVEANLVKDDATDACDPAKQYNDGLSSCSRCDFTTASGHQGDKNIAFYRE